MVGSSPAKKVDSLLQRPRGSGRQNISSICCLDCPWALQSNKTPQHLLPIVSSEFGHFSQTKPLSICCQSFPVSCKRQQSAFLDEHLDIFSGPEWASCRGYILKIFRPLAGLSKRPNINFPTPLFQDRPKSTLPSSCSHKLLMVTSEARSERSVTI